jgi:hypothetical protein
VYLHTVVWPNCLWNRFACIMTKGNFLLLCCLIQSIHTVCTSTVFDWCNVFLLTIKLGTSLSAKASNNCSFAFLYHRFSKFQHEIRHLTFSLAYSHPITSLLPLPIWYWESVASSSYLQNLENLYLVFWTSYGLKLVWHKHKYWYRQCLLIWLPKQQASQIKE